ncbi:unnamed protein product [Caretta caretta]
MSPTEKGVDSREAAAQAKSSDGNRRRDRLESRAAETSVVEGDKSGEEFGYWERTVLCMGELDGHIYGRTNVE